MRESQWAFYSPFPLPILLVAAMKLWHTACRRWSVLVGILHHARLRVECDLRESPYRWTIWLCSYCSNISLPQTILAGTMGVPVHARGHPSGLDREHDYILCFQQDKLSALGHFSTFTCPHCHPFGVIVLCVYAAITQDAVWNRNMIVSAIAMGA